MLPSDEDVPAYVVATACSGKTAQQVVEELNIFFGDYTPYFVNWLQNCVHEIQKLREKVAAISQISYTPEFQENQHPSITEEDPCVDSLSEQLEKITLNEESWMRKETQSIDQISNQLRQLSLNQGTWGRNQSQTVEELSYKLEELKFTKRFSVLLMQL